MVIIDDQEDMVDGLDMPVFFENSKNGNKEKQKSKTTNVTDLIRDINKNQNKRAFENTSNLSLLKKNSFFSQSKFSIYQSSHLDNAEEYCDDEEYGDQEITAYDERT